MFFRKTKIEAIATKKGEVKVFPSEYLLFSVQGGAGKLRVAEYNDGAKNDTAYECNFASALLLNDKPLVRMQSNGSPTCASLLAAGYGLPDNCEAVRRMREALTAPYVGLSDALKRLNQLLALLPSGAYVLTDTTHCPTDGEGRFFWNVPELFTECQATTLHYDDEKYRVLPSFPLFLYPTQSAEKYDAQRVAYYRARLRAGQPIPPVLTYVIDAYLCAILDGHHRACACALEGMRVPSLTIACSAREWRDGVPVILWPDRSEITLAELRHTGLELLSKPTMCKRLSKHKGFCGSAVRFDRKWEPEYKQMASIYPTCYEAGVLGLYPDVVLNTEGIRKLAMDEDYEEVTVAAQLLHYAARQIGADKKALAMEFTHIGYPAVLRKAAFEVLDSIKDDPEIDDIMIDILVNCEQKDDPLYEIANGHWEMQASFT